MGLASHYFSPKMPGRWSHWRIFKEQWSFLHTPILPHRPAFLYRYHKMATLIIDGMMMINSHAPALGHDEPDGDAQPPPMPRHGE